MPKPTLKPYFKNLQEEILATMFAGLKEWRPDLSYPKSMSDMHGMTHALMREFEITRRPIGLEYEEIIEEDKGDE